MPEITNSNIDGLQQEKVNIAVEYQQAEKDLKAAKDANDKVAVAKAEVALEELKERAKSVKEQLDAIDKTFAAAPTK